MYTQHPACILEMQSDPLVIFSNCWAHVNDVFMELA